MKNASAASALLALAACGVGTIGQPPEMTTIGRAEDDAPPILTAERAALAVPPPQPARYAYQQGSLWNTDADRACSATGGRGTSATS